MKTITIIAERVTDQALTAILPTSGVASVAVKPVAVSPNRAGASESAVMDGYQSFRNPSRFTPSVRIDLLVEDDTAETVFDAVSFAYAAGRFSDAEMWVQAPALALSA